MSSGFQPGDSRPHASDQEQDSREPAVGANMLEQILALSSGGQPQAGFVEPRDLQALCEITKKFAGKPFELEPIATALIHAMLEVQFGKAGLPAATADAMAAQIASTLCEDPTSRQRLEALWNELCARMS